VQGNQDRVAVITGASGGIGRACARAFAADGYRVALLARGAEGLRGAADDVAAAGSVALPLPVDTADDAALDEAAGRVEDELGPIDVWVNDAFTSVFAPFTEIGADEFRRVTEVSYLGFVNGTRAALARMRKRDRSPPTRSCTRPSTRAAEYWVGGSTAATLLANAVAPGVLDRYLARTGFGSQQTDRPREKDSPANLWHPADRSGAEDFGAHGGFNRCATRRSAQVWASRHHGLLGALGAGAAAGGGLVWLARRR
jgi:hypothetical protein